MKTKMDLQSKRILAIIAIIMLLFMHIRTMVALSGTGGVIAYVTTPYFVFAIFVIVVIYVLAWK